MWIEVTTSSSHSSQQERTRARDHHHFRILINPSFTEEILMSLRGWIFCYVFWFVECEWPIQNRTNWRMVHKKKKRASSDFRVSALVIKTGWCEQMPPHKSKTLWVRNKERNYDHCKKRQKKSILILSLLWDKERFVTVEFLAWDFRKLKSILAKIQPFIYLVTLISVS